MLKTDVGHDVKDKNNKNVLDSGDQHEKRW